MNKCILNKVFIFAAGAVIGSVATWKFVKNKYEKIAKEEIDSVKKNYAQRSLEEQMEKDFTEGCEGIKNEMREIKDIVDSEVDRLKTVLNENGYVNYSTLKEEKVTTMNPYVISPDEFSENEDYETESLTYYSDGILADDRDNIIDIDMVVGRDSLNHFGEYEDDSVFVRNEELKTDYEILLDTRRYSDIY